MFTNCSSLENVTIGNSVESIGSYAFQYCSSLTEITVGESVTSIGNYAFYECSSLKELNIPDSVTEIGASAFLGCSGIESFSIGAGIEHLIDYLLLRGSSAATCYPLLWQEGLSQVKSIALKDGPSSLSVAGYGRTDNNSATTGYPVFSNMYVENYYVGRPLTDIKNWTCSTTSKSYSFSITVSQPCGNIGTLEIGGYCNEVPYFYQRVENLILDKNVKTYDVGNIYQGELKNIVCESATPPTLSGTFDNSTYVNVVLSVPEGYKEVYQATDGWKDFWTIQEVVISGIDSVVNSGEVTEVGRYTVSGQKITTPQKGINIVRYSDGTTRKILVQ